MWRQSHVGPTNVCSCACVCIAARLEELRDTLLWHVLSSVLWRNKDSRCWIQTAELISQKRTCKFTHTLMHRRTYTQCGYMREREERGYDVTSTTIITRHKSCGVSRCHRVNGCPMRQPAMGALSCRVPLSHRTTELFWLTFLYLRFIFIFFFLCCLLSDTNYSRLFKKYSTDLTEKLTFSWGSCLWLSG